MHPCPGGDQDSTHTLDVEYTALLPKLLQLRVGAFYVQLASEPDPDKILAVIAEFLPADARIFVGVTDPIDPQVETPEQVRDRVLNAARYLPVDRLGTCDDCGFSPFADDTPPPPARSPSPRSAPASKEPLWRLRNWASDRRNQTCCVVGSTSIRGKGFSASSRYPISSKVRSSP
ncbi:hypothetical protein [Nocardia pseudovaccinii]|uniref:hypothetical protein n=1 Tax=Nocardia pseudovaccinii TaxID=189540 RepID=UPI001C3FD3DC|nr:hypothetical protein [Nocardia pseudovaccinii]